MEDTSIRNASFNLTHSCNLLCQYCFSGRSKSSNRMSFDVGKRAIDFLFKNVEGTNNRVDISFWGGEPLLEWKLLQDLVIYAKSKKRSVSFGGTTNGILLTEDKFDFLDEHKIFFMVSLDGTKETHDKYRVFRNGDGSHSIIMRNMEKVIKKWPFYKVRMSPYAEGIHRFYDDIKYLVEHGIYNIMFSPVYETQWTEERWDIWTNECFKVVDLIADYRKKGIRVEIEHFKSYQGPDKGVRPCGAGVFYVSIDYDGSIEPCHRYRKFHDNRPWQERPMCIGHVDVGITKPELRQKFIDWKPKRGCENCEYFYSTPCKGGCTAVSYDLTGDFRAAPDVLCRYVKMQKKVSEYYKERIGFEGRTMNNRGCICYNLCYLEETSQQVIDVDNSGFECQCYNTNYSGEINSNLAGKIHGRVVTPIQVMDLLRKLEERICKVEEGINSISSFSKQIEEAIKLLKVKT